MSNEKESTFEDDFSCFSEGEYDEKCGLWRIGTLEDKIMSICGNASLDESFHRWAYRIDASVPLDEVDIKPKGTVFILGEASVEKYCALCCKAAISGARTVGDQLFLTLQYWRELVHPQRCPGIH